MTQFLHDELRRLLGKLPETDPAGPEYLTVLQSLEVLAHSEWLDDIAGEVLAEPAAVQEVRNESAATGIAEDTIKSNTIVPFTPPQFTEAAEETATQDASYDIPDDPKPAPAPVTYTQEDVRQALLAYRSEHKDWDYKAFLSPWATSIPKLAAKDYADVMAALKELANA